MLAGLLEIAREPEARVRAWHSRRTSREQGCDGTVRRAPAGRARRGLSRFPRDCRAAIPRASRHVLPAETEAPAPSSTAGAPGFAQSLRESRHRAAGRSAQGPAPCRPRYRRGNRRSRAAARGRHADAERPRAERLSTSHPRAASSPADSACSGATWQLASRKQAPHPAGPVAAQVRRGIRPAEQCREIRLRR